MAEKDGREGAAQHYLYSCLQILKWQDYTKEWTLVLMIFPLVFIWREDSLIYMKKFIHYLYYFRSYVQKCIMFTQGAKHSCELTYGGEQERHRRSMEIMFSWGKTWKKQSNKLARKWLDKSYVEKSNRCDGEFHVGFSKGWEVWTVGPN